MEKEKHKWEQPQGGSLVWWVKLRGGASKTRGRCLLLFIGKRNRHILVLYWSREEDEMRATIVLFVSEGRNCEGKVGVSEFRVAWEVALCLEVISSLHCVVFGVLGWVESCDFLHVLRIMQGSNCHIRVEIGCSHCVPKARRIEQGGSSMPHVPKLVRVREIELSHCVPRA
ncbi:unnamed protein product [Lactuca saligna]|uniref:Uncharacterized protein n=1 Tax=Lactuca saligna TaxID=75948 RepID=A0AA36EC46_LACSI|nr:unnamed protein product [Lactuca saligna]